MTERRRVRIESARKYQGQESAKSAPYQPAHHQIAEQIAKLRAGHKNVYSVESRLTKEELQDLTPKTALQWLRQGKLEKREIPIVLYDLDLIKSPDDISPNEAVDLLVQAVRDGKRKGRDDYQDIIQEHERMVAGRDDNHPKKGSSKRRKFDSPEAKIAYQKQLRAASVGNRPPRRKGQYTGENTYTGNGGERPGEFREDESALELGSKFPDRYKERKRKVLRRKDKQVLRTEHQPKDDTDGPTEERLRDPRHEGLKAAMSKIQNQLGRLDIDDLQDLKTHIETLEKKDHRKEASTAIVTVDSHIPSPDELLTKPVDPSLIESLKRDLS